ncbi:MAG: efflux transporter outer membrane subunit [Planctomycetota bacterium]|jgi:NodT family efflux transporter outer membrane factor (OMF) lipoprotein
MKRSIYMTALLVACTASPPPQQVDFGFQIPEAWSAKKTAPGEVADEWWNLLGDDGLRVAVDEALLNNHDLQAAAARVGAASAQARFVGAELYPWLNGQLDATRQRQNFIGIPAVNNTVPSSTFNNFGVSLNLSWELDLWGRISSGHAAAIADLETARADYEAARLSLIAQTSKAWFAIAEARRQLELAQETVVSFRNTSEQVRDRFERGVRPSLDLRLALTNLAAAEASVEARSEQLERALRQLEILMGRYPDGSIEQAQILPEEFPEVPAGLPSSLLERRPDLVAAERQLAAAAARRNQASAARFPRIALTGGGGRASIEFHDLNDNDFRVWNIAGNLLAPIFEGGRLQADLDRNQALMLEAAELYSSFAQRAFSEVEIGLAIEDQLGRQEAFLREAADQSIAARDISEARYIQGLVDFLTVSDTQRSALTAESQWLELRRRRLDARIDLHLALGGGFTSEEVDS